MCSHYESPTAQRLLDGFGIAPDLPYKTDLWPTYTGPFIRARDEESIDDGDQECEALLGQFGLLPFWAKDRTLGRQTYNSRSETAATKPSFRSAWKNGQFCVIPAAAIFEPDWRSGKAVPTRITRTDEGVMAVAGLWDKWKSPDGELVHSYAMLTISAGDHSLMRHYHKPNDEKRMVVILPNGSIKDWLNATASQAAEFLRQYPADKLKAEAAPRQ